MDPSTDPHFGSIPIPNSELSRHAQSQSRLCEHAPRSDAAKPDPPSATGVVTYKNRFPSRFEIRVSFWNGYRELEERLRFDLAFKWFCGFTAFGETPDHRFFGRFRKAMGTKRIGVLFKAINRRAEENGLLKKTFRFADATAIETKQTTWEERDKALANGDEALNNQNIKKYSADPEARFGCKGKSKFWFGYTHPKMKPGADAFPNRSGHL